MIVASVSENYERFLLRFLYILRSDKAPVDMLARYLYQIAVALLRPGVETMP